MAGPLRGVHQRGKIQTAARKAMEREDMRGFRTPCRPMPNRQAIITNDLFLTAG